ncbi:MAG: aminopeptidase, partial [Ruminococcaceae bacterium]|nr:aminopeptidase [Oscillospiraceae bacterium]
LNILLGSEPEKNEEKDKIRENVLKALNQKYGITEADLLTAEITVVPAENARDLGFDRSLISAYGHDDRVCAYPCFTALLKTTAPKKTCVCVFADKEEIGSVGVTGLRSDFMTNFLLALCDGYNSRIAFANSAAISSDVAAAFDPNYPEVFERRNSAFINCGPAICKYTGHGGKSGASDACPEFIAKLLKIFDDANVIYQFTELGKVDQGGGGTVSQFIADRNIEVLDIGVAMLCMHAPCEVAAKTDIYLLDRLCEAFYKNY